MLLTLTELIGGLGLFIAGMNMMSRGIEKTAGNKLRSILATFTRSRFLGLVVGLFFTAVIQSSSAATVMVVTFVNSGLMKLAEASGIILGANIGTTVTALLVAFKLSAVAPLFVLAGAIMTNYVKKKPFVRKLGEVVLGFGILFVGISTMSAAMGSLRDNPAVINMLSSFTNPILGLLMGLVITSVVQSSSVTVSIMVVMGSQNLVSLEICLYVILGCNIGACTSAVLAALGGGRNAKRAALIHLLFNVFGTVLMFILLKLFPQPIERIIRMCGGEGLGSCIAMAHFLFKVFQVIVFYPFTSLLVKLTYVLVPGEDAEVTEDAANHFILKYINDDSLPNPTVATFLAVKEIERMATKAFRNLNLAMDALYTNDTAKAAQVAQTENYVDFLEERITAYLVRINQNTLPFRDAALIAAYFHVVSDIERIGDHAETIIELMPQLYANGETLDAGSFDELKAMMVKVNLILEKALFMFVNDTTQGMDEVTALENELDEMERTMNANHIVALSEGRHSARTGVIFSDIVMGLERVGDHATNIAFSLMEAKGQKAAHAFEEEEQVG